MELGEWREVSFVGCPRVVHTTPKTFTPGKLTAPSFVPKAVAIPNDAAPPGGSSNGNGGRRAGRDRRGTNLAGYSGGVMNGVAGPVAPTAVSEGPKQPVRVGGNVKPPRLLSGPAPIYPILARQSRIQGCVVIEAIIDDMAT